MIPNGWEEYCLEELADVSRGRFLARPRNDPQFYGGNVPFVQTGDVTSSQIYLIRYTQTLNEKGVKISRVFKKNTILMTIAANIGDTAIASFDVACPDSIVAIQAHPHKTDFLWLKYKLETYKDFLSSQAPKNAQKNINLQILNPLVIDTPPLLEQKKIAKILSTWDTAISTTEALINNSKQQKQALMQQLLTGKRRFAGFGDKWKQVKLEKLVSICTGKKDVNQGNPKGLYPFFTCAKEITASDSFSFDTEAILISGNGVGVGMIHYYNGKFEVYQRTYVLNRFNNLYSFYLYFYLQHFLKNSISQEKQNGAMPYIKIGLLNDFIIFLPLLQEQQKIASVLTAADKEIETLEQQLAHLKQEKKALMQQLLTGKRRVTILTSGG